MEEAHLRKLASDYLLPLFSGAALEESAIPSTGREDCAAVIHNTKIAFKAEKDDRYRLVLTRSQPFYPLDLKGVQVLDVIGAFVEIVRGMKEGLSSWYHADLHASFPRRVVAKALSQSVAQEDALLTAIDQLSEWGGCQYEGKPIPASLGFVPDAKPGAVSFAEFCVEKFSAVISNGFDSLVTCDLSGTVIGHECLPLPERQPSFAPHRLSAVADWARDTKLALVLNRSGEIMVFKNRELTFTRRAGRWHFLTHKPVLTQMRRPESLMVRRAIYESALDASFARTGAGIGVVMRINQRKWETVVTAKEDWLSPPTSTKAKAIARMINGRPFQELDRRLRQELLAIDGATVLDHLGKVLAVGAIIRIPGGSTEGGRLAAAKELSKLGLGIKVSQDGGIVAFENQAHRFSVM